MVVDKLNLLRDLLHKLADFITDFLSLLSKFKELFSSSENGVIDENIENTKEESVSDNS